MGVIVVQGINEVMVVRPCIKQEVVGCLVVLVVLLSGYVGFNGVLKIMFGWRFV